MSSSYHRRQKTIRTTMSYESIIVRAASGLLFCLLLLGIAASAPAQTRWLPAAGNDAYDHLVTHGLTVEDFLPTVRVRRPSAPQVVVSGVHVSSMHSPVDMSQN